MSHGEEHKEHVPSMRKSKCKGPGIRLSMSSQRSSMEGGVLRRAEGSWNG